MQVNALRQINKLPQAIWKLITKMTKAKLRSSKDIELTIEGDVGDSVVWGCRQLEQKAYKTIEA